MARTRETGAKAADMTPALVIGGTGPTGPFVVNGLVDRGYTVTILHSGLHGAEFKQDIQHIHADVHFPDTLSAAIHGPDR